MKFYTIVFLLATAVFVESGHIFLGSNVERPLAYRKVADFPARKNHRRIEYMNFTLPVAGETIHGLLAFDLEYSKAKVNVTWGGIGYSYVTLRFKSERNKNMTYDVYIYP